MNKKANSVKGALNAFRNLPVQARQFNAQVRKPRAVGPQAPHLYGPQAPPKVLQTKKSLATSATRDRGNCSRPAAPPAYRPQPTTKVLQRKAIASAQPVSAACAVSRKSPPTPRAVTPSSRGVVQRAGENNQQRITDFFLPAKQQKQQVVRPQAPVPGLAPALAHAPALPQAPGPPRAAVPGAPMLQPPVVLHPPVLAQPRPPQPAPQAFPQPPPPLFPQHAPPPAIAQPQPINPVDIMNIIETKVGATPFELVYFAVEGKKVSGPFNVSQGKHAEENAFQSIGAAVSLFTEQSGRRPAFVCVFSTYSPCKEYTAMGSHTPHNCSKQLWEGDGDEQRKAATRAKSIQGIAEMKAAGWKFI
jgi:hypothetical protein